MGRGVKKRTVVAITDIFCNEGEVCFMGINSDDLDFDDKGSDDSGGHEPIDESNLKEELESLKKELFLATYNLFQISKKHEQVLTTIEANLQTIADAILRNPPARSVVAQPAQASSVQAPTAVQQEAGAGGFPVWGYIAVSAVALMVVGVALFAVMR